MNWTPHRIRTLRKRLDLSQPLFADAVGVHERTVRAWEAGSSAPKGTAARRRLTELATQAAAQPA